MSTVSSDGNNVSVVSMTTPRSSFRAREEMIKSVRKWLIETDREIESGRMEYQDLTDAEMQLYQKAKNFFD